jgi:hypothetical protein
MKKDLRDTRFWRRKEDLNDEEREEVGRLLERNHWGLFAQWDQPRRLCTRA